MTDAERDPRQAPAGAASFHAVIPAGGAGTRLWPLSRRGAPKFLHDLTGSGRTLVQATYDRLAPIADGVLVVTGEAHRDAIMRQVPDLRGEDVLAEPSPRDSMAAVGLAAAVLVHRHPDDDVVLGSFAADHVIRGRREFERAVSAAIEAARLGYVVTIGIAADQPSTAFGYIEVGEPLDGDARAGGDVGARHVVAFTEKPDAATAARYIATGSYRWNAGMFVVRARVLLEHLRRLQPALHDSLVAIAADWDTGSRAATTARLWPTLTPIAIDHAIAEPVAAEGGVAVVPGDFAWDDVGDWRSLADLLPRSEEGVSVLGDAAQTLALDSPGAVLVPGSGRRIVVLGLADAVVVDTPDALLVTTRGRAQQVRSVVDALAADGADSML